MAKRRNSDREERPIITGSCLREFISNLGPPYEYPDHLQPLIDIIEGVLSGESIGKSFSVHTPPQHGKTTQSLFGLIWLAQQLPGIQIAFVTHTEDRKKSVEKQARIMVRTAGYTIVDGTSKEEWEIASDEVLCNSTLWTFAGEDNRRSKIRWTYANGPITGESLDFVLLDDLYKSVKDAASTALRETLEEWVSTAALTRWRMGGKGVLLNINTRFHPKDMSAFLVAHHNAIQTTLPALRLIDGQEVALWPERHSVEYLNTKRLANPIEFDAIYQGDPRSGDYQLFKEPTFYKELPKELTYFLGMDLAYTSKTQSDFSAIAILGQDKITNKVYLIDVYRAQTALPTFVLQLLNFQDKYPGRYSFIGSGSEAHIAETLRTHYHVRVKYENTNTDKVVRAQMLSVAWNNGSFLLPDPSIIDSPHHKAMRLEFEAFTGYQDEHDDMVDAVVTAYNAIRSRTHSKWEDLPQDLTLWG